MILHGHHDLAGFEALPAPTRAQLKSCWVESVEEYLGLLAGLEAGKVQGGTVADARSSARSVVGEAAALELTEARPGGALGLEVGDEAIRLFRATRRAGGRREGRPLGWEAGAGGGSLPASVRLLDRTGAPRSQGYRGTCVAFATVALREFVENLAGAGTSPELSEQFLYWACKELDGRPGPGTTLHTAMGALSQYGCCRATTWPYVGEPRESSEGQGPPTAGALEEARRYRMADCRPVEPGLVEQYKRMLAGWDGAPPMPVVVGVLVFASWYYSPAAHRSGKLTLPLSHEEPISGHAMCVVGYVDDEGVPGGGYFILRNSWGPEWAAASPERPGHALVPYAYVEAYCLEAFTGPSRPGRASPRRGRGWEAGDDPELAGRLRELEKDTRDQDGTPGQGRLLSAGTVVLFHPLAPDEVMESTPENVRRFKAQDGTWTTPTRQRVWFPASSGFAASLREDLDRARARRRRFVETVRRNLEGAVGTPFPIWREPGWRAWLPFAWERAIRGERRAADLTDAWLEELRRQAGVPSEVPWSGDWTEWLRAVNAMEVRELTRGREACHVVFAHVYPLACRRGVEPHCAPVTRALLDGVRAVYARWRATANIRASTGVYFVIAWEGTLPKLVEPPAGDASAEVWVAYRRDGTWEVPVGSCDVARRSLRNFLDRLKPETREERLARIRDVVEEELEMDRGNVSESRIKLRTKYRRSLVRDAFFHLQTTYPDRYVLVRLQEGELAIRERKQGEGPGVRSPREAREAVRRHVLGIVALSVGALLGFGQSWLKDWLGLPGWVSTAFGIVIAYVGQLVQKRINEHVERGRD